MTQTSLGGAQILSQTKNGITSTLLPDAQGSTRLLTNASGAVIAAQAFEYSAFGDLLSASTPETRYLYTGQQYDSATDLYSLRARYYDAGVGRFMSRDTWAYDFANPVELNRYVYVANNPISFSDPSGYGLIESVKLRLTAFGTVITTGLIKLQDWVNTSLTRIFVELDYRLHQFLRFLIEKFRFDPSQGNIWQRITEPALNWIGTKIPKSFILDVNGTRFFVTESATKHMGQYIERANAYGSGEGIKIASQTLLSSFHAAVEQAVRAGIVYDQRILVGSWELIFGRGRGGPLDVIYHAVFRP